ncbi:MAG: ABC transporter ATP-binding protein [Clostridia bacterium]|nr:ABC transporter ATP-binding protein [Clostridia bacterium]
MTVLSLEGVRKAYQTPQGETVALQDVTFSMEKGEFYSLVGPSGCGKSTLLSIVAGTLAPTAGRVTVAGEPVSGPCPHIGYMLQQDNLLEWRTVRQNVLLGLEIRHQLTPVMRERAEHLLETYGLAEFANSRPSQLSGGMRQRVALIRTLAVEPDILLLDEAFSALDYQTRLEVTEDVYRIIRQEQVTALMVTHDIPESICMGDKVLILSPRPAVVQEILPITFDQPKRSPLRCRSCPEFASYFNYIWKELGMNETHSDPGDPLSGAGPLPAAD